MKAVKATLGRAIDQPDAAIRFYLFHGPDEAGSRALALRLLRGLGDAEKFIVLGNAVEGDPAALADEAGAMALFGGRRAIWIEPAGDEITDGALALLESPGCESAVIAIAGSLGKASALLKLAEGHALALAHISYAPDARAFAQTVAELLRDAGLQAEHGVAERIAAGAALNPAIAAQEAEKYSLYLNAAPDRPKPLDHAAIDAIGADANEADWLGLGDLALAGRGDALLEELSRLSAQGAEAIPAVRAMQRRLSMLAPLRARVERGESVDGVMTSMGKALFWRDKPLLKQLLSSWSAARLAQAMQRISRLERELMLGDAPAAAALGETMIAIARQARGR